MELLSNGCKRSNIAVTPANWKTTSSVKKDWKIYYRFHDPKHTGKGTRYPKGKYVPVYGMNDLKNIDQRRAFTKNLIEEIRHDLDECDYNPITGYRKTIFEIEKTEYEIHPDTPLVEAWEAAYEKSKVKSKKELKSVRKYADQAAKDLKIDKMPVKDVRRRHMLALLDRIGAIKGDKWTNSNYNYFKARLGMLFSVLYTWEATELNPMNKIPLLEHAVKKRTTLSLEQKVAIDRDLRRDNYRLWLAMQLFFYSGARETEMVDVKLEDVNIKSQEVTYLILKGGMRYETRAIPINAVNLWDQAMVGAKPGEYLFSWGLKPGKRKVGPEIFNRWWKKFVKDKVDADGNKVYGENLADFYAFKHSHSSQVSKMVGTRLAALHNQHSEEILREIYDTEGEDRDMKILKGIIIDFVPVAQ